MQIFIKTLTGGTSTFQVESTDSVGSLKAMIERRAGWPIDQQRLVCNDKALEDDQTLADYNIQEETIIQLVPFLRGGATIVQSSDSEAIETDSIEIHESDADSEGPRHSFFRKYIGWLLRWLGRR